MTTVQPIITTPDLDRLRAFYEGVFGAVEERRHPDDGPAFFVGLRLGDSRLGLVHDAAADPSTPQRILLSVAVDDVDGLLDRVEAAGGRVLGPPTDMPWGQRVAHVHDPDGNMVNLTRPTLGSDGQVRGNHPKGG
ncbi:VOC family protein [Thermostaphylospora chromogena]|uniref:VOC domain-containing protein n=1 Tax=Thermostaphylospora chromogena TaxID=35622 RepID=A0A1H1BCU2_9ACTN|nr:VOC family protein [Thermostaphylospora chromogena]SDQ49693.1 hypothetical protein SAMN04489764_0904 [Thermostaphylospora chromogena]